MTAFLCIVVSPVLAKAPAVNSAVPSLPNISVQTQSLVQQGKTLYEAGQFTEAVKILQQAAAAFKATGDGLSQAMTLSNLSLAYQQLGQWPQAKQAIRKAIASLHPQRLNLLQTGRNMGTSNERSQILAQSLDVQGRLQLVRGQAELALTTWRQAADTYAQVGDNAGITRSRINQAQALQALGLYSQAQKTLTEVNQTLQKEPDSSLKATGLRSLGNVFRVVGNLKKSRQVLEQSRDVARASQSNQAISDALLSLGNTARAQQDTQAALKFYQQAATASASPTTLIQAQLNQLSLLLETEQWAAAQALWPQIQPQITDLPPSRTAVYARINFAQGLTRLRQYTTGETPLWQDIAQLLATAVQQAKNLGDQPATSYAIGNLGELYEQTQQWSDAQDLTQQALFIAQAIDAEDIAYRWQWQLGRLLRNQGNIQGAIAAYTEAVNNLKSLRSDLVAINPDVQFSFRDEVEPVYRQLVDLLLKSEKGSKASQKNLQQAREVIESLQLAELANFFRENCLDPLRPIDQVDVKAAVIYPILLDDRLEVILSLPGQNLRHYATPLPSHQVESRVESLRQNLIKPDTSEDIKPQFQEVCNWLIQPAQTALAESGVETLVFVLDGPLRNIPMAALYDGEQYLVEKYSVALTPGLQLVDPKPLAQRQLKALTAGLSEERQGFPPLEFVKLELAQIKSEIPSEVLLNQEFTTRILDNKVNSSPVPVVHIATHGQFSSQAEDTFILAWDDRINVNELNNLLRRARDQNLSGTLELLVLSACETATGDKRAALGLAGVAVRAGARSTLASLWAVEDESTALLMSHFYQELKTGVTKAEALRRAQQALLQGKYEDPRLWAAFVLLGNWL
jgi:CHAT domain-containing protein